MELSPYPFGDYPHSKRAKLDSELTFQLNKVPKVKEMLCMQLKCKLFFRSGEFMVCSQDEMTTWTNLVFKQQYKNGGLNKHWNI